jgi:hypothetical protein
MGNFETARPSADLMSGLARVLAWKAYQYGVRPQTTVKLTTGSSTGTGTRAGPGSTVTVPRILMHKTTNYTSCPGRYLAARMAGLRDNVKARRDRALARYGDVRWTTARPERVAPTSAQAPVQWARTARYSWKPVRGAVAYQVLERRADWNDDMPSSRYWRLVDSWTTARSIAVELRPGQTRHLAVRAIDSKYRRGPVSTLVVNTRQISADDWRRSAGWQRLSADYYFSDVAYRTTTRGATITLAGANDVRHIRVRAATNPADGRVQVAVGGTVYGTLNLAGASDGDRTFTVSLPRRLDGNVTLRAVDSGKQVRISSIALIR